MNWRGVRDLLGLVHLQLPWWALLLRNVDSLVEHYVLLDATTIARQVEPRVTMCNFTVLLFIQVIVHLAHLSWPLCLPGDDRLLIIIDSTTQYLRSALELLRRLNRVLGNDRSRVRANDLLGLTLCNSSLVSLISCTTIIRVTD